MDAAAIPESLPQALVIVFLATLGFLVCGWVARRTVGSLLAGYSGHGPRQKTTAVLTGAVAGETLALGLLIIFIGARGGSLAGLGLGRPATSWGWMAAGVVTALFVGSMLAGPLRGQAPLGEMSFFHFYNSIIAGLGAGFCEEIVFRGFLMTELQTGGAGPAAQILFSGLLFGLAHFRMGGVRGGFDLKTSLRSVVPTAIMGALYAGVYLLGGRSLAPVIAAHAITDLIIEPWLVLAAVGGTLGRARG